ncbi:MAG: ISL3 family transposase, partial [Jiangellaceae bacterium]
EARCPNAELCLDPFHIVSWATKALDEVRREVWNAARRNGQKAVAKDLKGARYALWKNPEDLTARQAAKLADIAHSNQRLYRAYLLKEQLRQVFALNGRRPDRPPRRMVEVGAPMPHPVIRETRQGEHRAGIDTALTHGLSNARVESVNTKLRLLTRIALGFRSPEALVALTMLNLGGPCPPLPGRPTT